MEAVIQEENEFKKFIDVFARRKLQGLAIALAILFVATLFALFLPAIYRSQAIILIEQQEIPSDYVRSTVTSFADQRIQVISQRVMTSSNLGGIIDKYELYKDLRRREPREVVLEEMRDRIKRRMISADVVDPRSGRPTEATIAFSLAYENESPALAQKVTNELVSLFLNENLKSRKEMAEETSDFLDEEAAKLEAQVTELEKQLAEFKEKNVESLPELLDRNYSVRDRTEQDIVRVNQQISSLRERQIYLEAQLAQIPPYGTTYSPDGQRILGSADRLKALKTDLIAAKAKYGDAHPDVRRLTKEIASLENESGDVSTSRVLRERVEQTKTELTTLSEKYSAQHPELSAKRQELASLEQELRMARSNAPINNDPVEPDNSAYIQIKAQLVATKSEMRAAIDRRAKLEGKVEEYDRRLSESAGVEREFRSLGRRYEIALRKYQEITAKRLEADVSESLELEQKGERFTLIEPPLIPEKPARPNRWAIFFIGVVIALGGGAGTVSMLEALDDKVRGRRGVKAIFNAPPIGVIPTISVGKPSRRKRQQRYLILTLGALFLIALIVAMLVHVLYMPLDVFWYAALRKLGIWST